MTKDTANNEGLTPFEQTIAALSYSELKEALTTELENARDRQRVLAIAYALEGKLLKMRARRNGRDSDAIQSEAADKIHLHHIVDGTLNRDLSPGAMTGAILTGISNGITDAARKVGLHPTQGLPGHDDMRTFIGATVSGRDEQARVDAAEFLQVATAHLSKDHNTVLTLLLADLTYEEIKKELGKPMGTVKRLIYETKREIGKEAARQGLEPSDFNKESDSFGHKRDGIAVERVVGKKKKHLASGDGGHSDPEAVGEGVLPQVETSPPRKPHFHTKAVEGTTGQPGKLGEERADHLLKPRITKRQILSKQDVQRN